MNSRKLFTIVFHLLAWGLLFSIPVLFRPASAHFHRREFFELPELIWNILLVGLFYLNAYLLIPWFLSKEKYVSYIGFVVLSFALILSVNVLVTYNYYPVPYMRHSAFKLFPCIFIFAISTSFRIINDNIKLDRIRKEKENENLKTELSFLRSQVSPHFMFNVLNSMVSLARKRSERLEPVLIELSSLMRYMLYESGDEKVSVEKEIEYLRSYINLQTLRFGDDVNVNVDVKSFRVDSYVEPMLLIPLVENAFKHGVGMIEHPEITIKIDNENDGLNVMVRNKFNKNKSEEKDKNSGIGLSNLKRRLDLLYPGKYALTISEEESLFIVSLNLQLK